MHGNKHLSLLSVTSVCKQWNVMYDGNSLQIHFIAKDDSNCSPLYRLQLVSLFCRKIWMPNSTRIFRHWTDNCLIEYKGFVLLMLSCLYLIRRQAVKLKKYCHYVRVLYDMSDFLFIPVQVHMFVHLHVYSYMKVHFILFAAVIVSRWECCT